MRSSASFLIHALIFSFCPDDSCTEEAVAAAAAAPPDAAAAARREEVTWASWEVYWL